VLLVLLSPSRPPTYSSLKNHQSLISLCVTSSVESTSCLIPPAIVQNTILMMSHLQIHLPPITLTHHTFTVSFQAQNSPFPQIVSTIVCYSTHLNCLLGLYWSGLSRLNGFSFLVIFYFGCAVD